MNSVYQETHQDSSKFYTPASNTAVSLFRIVVNVSFEYLQWFLNNLLFKLLRCETSDIREIVIRGLGRTNPEAFKFVKTKMYILIICIFVFFY